MDDKPITNDLCWKIGGPAGFGIASAGTVFATACMRAGLNAFVLSENPSLIRGGHNHVTVHVKERQVGSHLARTDVLVALDQQTMDNHVAKIVKGGGVIFDPDEVKTPEVHDVKLFNVPIKRLCQENGGLILRNTIAMGATAGLLDFEPRFLESVLKDNFAKKGDKVIDMNLNAFKAGYDYVKKEYPSGSGFVLSKRKPNDNVLVSGNAAVAFGAVSAGCTFMSAYPMTPATSVFETMASLAKDYGLVVRQAEDEIAAVNQAIGASFAGAISMTGTSGGGFCLMVEGLGLSMQSEMPVVIIESQRPGPATGMATRTAQGDLRFILHCSTDDSPRLVLTPGDMEECFSVTAKAFELTEKYQMPAVVMVDKFLSLSYATTPAFKGGDNKRYIMTDRDASKLKNYKRYDLTDCVSPRAVPGQKGGQHWASSYEHDEYGHESEDKTNKIRMSQKRFCKLDLAAKDVPQPKIHGHSKADMTIIGWGSTKGPIREAIALLEEKGVKVNHLHLNIISPFPEQAITKAIKDASKTIIVENNQSGQLAGIIKERTGLDVDYTLLKYDGRNFFPEEISGHIVKILER